MTQQILNCLKHPERTATHYFVAEGKKRVVPGCADCAAEARKRGIDARVGSLPPTEKVADWLEYKNDITFPPRGQF